MKNSFLRIISLILVVLLAFSSVAILSSCDCGGGDDNETTTGDGSKDPSIFDEPIEVDSIATAILAAIQKGSIEVSFKETEETTPIFNAPAEIVAKLFSNIADGKFALQVKPTVDGETLFDGGIYVSADEVIAVLTPFLENAYGVKLDNFFGNLSTSTLAETLDAMLTGAVNGEGEGDALTPVKEISALLAGLEGDLTKLGTILEKYIDLIGTELDKIPATTKEEQITVDGKTVNTTVTTYTIDKEVIITLVNNILNAVKNDAELKALVAPYYNVVSKYFALAIRSESKADNEARPLPEDEQYSEPATEEAVEDEEFTLPTLDEIFEMIPTLTEDDIDADIEFYVSAWESNETKSLVKFALNGEASWEAKDQIYNEEIEDYEDITYTLGGKMDFSAVIGETAMDVDFVWTPINSRYTEEEIKEETVEIKFDATYDEENLDMHLTAGTPDEIYFAIDSVTDILENGVKTKADVTVNNIYDGEEENYYSAIGSCEIETTMNEETGAFESNVKMLGTIQYDGSQKEEVINVVANLKNAVETSTDEMEKGKMTLNVTAKVMEETTTVSLEMPYEIHADGNFKFEVNSDFMGTKYYALLENKMENENKGVLSIALSMKVEDEETMAHSGKVSYEKNEEGDFSFTFNYYDNANFSTTENGLTVSFKLDVIENTEKLEKGAINASLEMGGSKFDAALTYEHDKTTGVFKLGVEVKSTVEGETSTIFNGKLEGNFLLDKNGFVLKLGKLDVTMGEETMSFVIDLTVTVKANDEMPKFPEYTDIFDLNEETLGSLIEEITANFPSFGGSDTGDEYPENKEF